MPQPPDLAPAPDVEPTAASEADASLVDLIRRTLRPPGPANQPGGPSDAPRGRSAPAGRIGKFEVLGEIGRGGFGTVLLVRDPDLGRERALKVPNPDTLESPGALARFLDEARLAARVDHPNVVRIYDATTDGILPYIVMEYCPGGSLGRWLAARPKPDPLPRRWVAGLVAEIAEGVQQAHLAGLLHRDVKPANILLERLGPGEPDDPPRFRPKIADFGLAKAFEEDGVGRSMTASGTPLGTWAYMSPEQARGDSKILATTDVYAIGAILFELLAGRRLHDGLAQAEILKSLISPDPLPSPAASRKGLHRDLDTICRKALEKAPGDRYQNPSELANDLRRHLGGLPIFARPAPFWRRATSVVKRRPVRSAMTGIALASAVAAALAWSSYRERERLGQLRILLNDLANAPVARFPELIPRIDPTDPTASARLDELFAEGPPAGKLAASLARAKVRPEARDYAYRRLLEAEPREIAPIAGLLSDRMGDLPERLANEVEAPAPAGAPISIAEAHDRRRAVAAVALIALGRGDRGWPLLRFAPDPQPRAMLVHLLGPSGIDPGRIVDRLRREPDASARRALILALGEVSAEAWGGAIPPGPVDWLLDRYRDDEDSGIHGAAKWLLLKWSRDKRVGALDARIGSIDEELRNLGRRERFRWRMGPAGLTFVAVTMKDGSEVEVSDTEVTLEAFRRFRPGHPSDPQQAEADGPANQLSETLFFAFCEWLGDRDSIPAEDRCHQVLGDGLAPSAEYSRKNGYRLLLPHEFETAARAGAITANPCGEPSSMLHHYANCKRPDLPARPSRVASYKPNDLGIFDLFGNLLEPTLRAPGAHPDARLQLRGGSMNMIDSSVNLGSTLNVARSMLGGYRLIGLRVARTLTPPPLDTHTARR